MVNPVLQVKNLSDISDEVKRRKLQKQLLTIVRESVNSFQDAYRPRRDRLLELNAIYRNLSYYDKNRANWQTKVFNPLSYDAVERKTSIVHQSLWGNRIASPYTAMGRTAEDHAYALSAENLLNNTMDRIGFYGTSEECLRSTIKYGLGVYHYGWQYLTDEVLWRETKRDEKGQVIRDKDKNPVYTYTIKKLKISQPFVKSIDVVDHVFWDPTAKCFDKYSCDFVGYIDEQSAESIFDDEISGKYDKGSFERLSQMDPHGLDSLALDLKTPQIRTTEGVLENPVAPKTRHAIVHWFGWFDVDGDGKREFVKVSIADNKVILAARTNLMGEYPFVDVQYSRSLHGLTPWGVLDPVLQLQYYANEILCMRGDSLKLKIVPQFIINVDKILEDHAYIAEPGAFHPFRAGEESVSNMMAPLQFQTLDFLSVNEEDRLLSQFAQATGIADLNKVLTSSNKDTPASTVISILNEQQAGNSMIINGILERHGVLGSRVLRLLQLFGDESFILRSSGRQGLEFRKESLENVLGEFDIKVTTSTFFGNKQIELQQLIQLKPLWAQASHIDQIELDRMILENIAPKRVEKILRVPQQPLAPIDELLLFLAGQGESVTLSELEDLPTLTAKLKFHERVSKPEVSKMDGLSQEEFNLYLDKLRNRIQSLEAQQLMQQQAAARALPEEEGVPGMGGNMMNTGNPLVRQLGNQARPATNNLPRL